MDPEPLSQGFSRQPAFRYQHTVSYKIQILLNSCLQLWGKQYVETMHYLCCRCRSIFHISSHMDTVDHSAALFFGLTVGFIAIPLLYAIMSFSENTTSPLLTCSSPSHGLGRVLTHGTSGVVLCGYLAYLATRASAGFLSKNVIHSKQ